MMLDVIIVSPEYATEDFKPNSQMDLGEEVMHKPTGITCPHLELKDDGYYCKVHSMPWYKDTPCAAHGQVESAVTDNCRMGEYILNDNQMMKDKLKEIYEKTTI